LNIPWLGPLSGSLIPGFRPLRIPAQRMSGFEGLGRMDLKECRLLESSAAGCR